MNTIASIISFEIKAKQMNNLRAASNAADGKEAEDSAEERHHSSCIHDWAQRTQEIWEIEWSDEVER